jgi:hypothetical protein
MNRSSYSKKPYQLHETALYGSGSTSLYLQDLRNRLSKIVVIVEILMNKSK